MTDPTPIRCANPASLPCVWDPTRCATHKLNEVEEVLGISVERLLERPDHTGCRIYECVECGHLHWDGTHRDYIDCPIDCGCVGIWHGVKPQAAPKPVHTSRGEVIGPEGRPYGQTHDRDCPACVANDAPWGADPRSEAYWAN